MSYIDVFLVFGGEVFGAEDSLQFVHFVVAFAYSHFDVMSVF